MTSNSGTGCEVSSSPATFSIPLLQQVAFYLDATQVYVLVATARAAWRGVTPDVRSSVLRWQFGNEEGAWLARCSPRKRVEALNQLAASRSPQVLTCRMLAGEVEYESHTLVAIPRVAWPSRLHTDIVGLMVLFGGVHGSEFEPLADTSLITLQGDPRASRLEASRETFDLESVPPARFSHMAVWLHDLSAMAVFGGRRSADTDESAALGDVWLFIRNVAMADQPEWRWHEVGAASLAAEAPVARCNFASCELSGRSFFVHGGHSCRLRDGLLADAWVCWIDDGFDELDDWGEFDGPTTQWKQAAEASEATGSRCPMTISCSRLTTPLSPRVMDELTWQVSKSYRKLAPQVSVSSREPNSRWSRQQSPDLDAPLFTAVWQRVEADGTPPLPCCGHAATRCRDGIVIHGVWSGSSTSHWLGPIHVLEGLAGPAVRPGTGRRPHYVRLSLPCLTACRPMATLHTVGGRPVLVGGWGENDPAGATRRAWHASCKLPLNEACGPLIAVYGGRDFNGGTRRDLLVLHWLAGSADRQRFS